MMVVVERGREVKENERSPAKFVLGSRMYSVCKADGPTKIM